MHGLTISTIKYASNSLAGLPLRDFSRNETISVRVSSRCTPKAKTMMEMAVAGVVAAAASVVVMVMMVVMVVMVVVDDGGDGGGG